MSRPGGVNVLIIGSGGREHAMAWKIAQSPRLGSLFIAPGNPGTQRLGANVTLSPDDHAGIAAFCHERGIDLVMIGPEAPLAAGLADALRRHEIKVFGPSAAAAQIESSKAFSKAFMQRHGIPTACFGVFTEYELAQRYLSLVGTGVVIKASGLAAGKGVLLPETPDEARQALRSILDEREFGDAGRQVIIEERLSGPEVSLLAFTDGKTVRPMLPAQDHKRLMDGDHGPNTGGMGAYAPAPICPQELVDQLVTSVLQPAVDGMAAEGMPYVGVIYAGLMLTEAGVQVLEFNCRFGDPETQALLPLLKTDLLEIALACVDGRLDTIPVEWMDGSAACVVMASGGYPGKPESDQAIVGTDDLPQSSACFHAGTKISNGQLLTAGGRVLGITGWGDSLEVALSRAYQAVQGISFSGMQFRKDIGYQAIGTKRGSAYAGAGVNIDAGNRAVRLMSAAVKSTYTPNVLGGIGSFGGLFDVQFLQGCRHPVLVASTDGVGTKVKLAAQAGRYHGIGRDIVNHCINDILVQGASPLFFLDYFATSAVQPEVTAEIVSGIAAACREAGCVLLGGETAEMPGVYSPGEFDVAGTIVGLVERENILPRTDLCAGDVLVGLLSSGPHTNGYSLIRRVFEGVSLETVYPELDISLADALLAPHRSYLPLLSPLLEHPARPIKALAHLTGGGFLENIPRVLPDGLQALVQCTSWPIPALFNLIQERGNISNEEMLRVFNMGIGMVLITTPENVELVRSLIPEEIWCIGELAQGEKGVVLR
jgi:phosphoribosylamine--glycine ligase/phosphoribosylformylglycinamidine cyclo-ligase